MRGLMDEDRIISDDLNKLLNDQSAWREIGYDEVSTKSAHSPRSRQMLYEYNNPWHGTMKDPYPDVPSK